MTYITFGKSKLLNKLFYLYVISIILGGSMYLINDALGYEVNGLVFINNGYSINLIILIVISPIIIYLYIKEYVIYKKRINTEYDILIKFKNKTINVVGFLDTGNKLIDPYFKRSIVLINKKYISLRGKKIIYVPYEALNSDGLLKCIRFEYILIDNKKYTNVLIGIIDNLKVDCILNERIFKDENDNR